jgi:hypothetical protein
VINSFHIYRCHRAAREDQKLGFRWEALEHLKIGGGAKVYSLRLSQRLRAVGLRDGNFLRLISLHPDHDSTDERK